MQFKLFMPCPICVHEKRIELQSWTHGGTCGGRLTIDHKAVIHCNKCGKSAHIRDMRMSCAHNHTKMHASKKNIASAIAIGNVGVKNDVIKWFKSIIDHL